MRDLGRIQNDQQFWITRGQLGALAVTTVAVAALAFFVGVMVGQQDVPLPAGLGQDDALVDAALRDDAITELLARVETAASSRIPEAHARAPERELTFPADLVAEEEQGSVPLADESEPVALADLQLDRVEPDALASEVLADGALDEPSVAPMVLEPEPQEAIEPPSEPSGALPTSGYVIQVYSFPDPAEAQREVDALAGKGFPAYRVAAIVGGSTWHRVRIGPFDSQAEARGAIPKVSAELGVADPLVTKAP